MRDSTSRDLGDKLTKDECQAILEHDEKVWEHFEAGTKEALPTIGQFNAKTCESCEHNRYKKAKNTSNGSLPHRCFMCLRDRFRQITPKCPLCSATLVKKYPGGNEPYWPWWGCDSCRKWIRAWTGLEYEQFKESLK